MHCLHHWCVYRLMITVHWWRNSARIIFWRATSKHTLRVLCITTTAVVSVQTLTSVCSSIKSHAILFNRPICKNNLTIVMWILGFSSRRPKVDSCWQLCRVRKGLRYIQCSSAVSVSPRWQPNMSELSIKDFRSGWPSIFQSSHGINFKTAAQWTII